MKVFLKNKKGMKIPVMTDFQEAPCDIIDRLLAEHFKGMHFFSRSEAFDYFMDGEIDSNNSSFELLDNDGKWIKADWDEPMCNQEDIKGGIERIEKKGLIPIFFVDIDCSIGPKDTCRYVLQLMFKDEETEFDFKIARNGIDFNGIILFRSCNPVKISVLDKKAFFDWHSKIVLDYKRTKGLEDGVIYDCFGTDKNFKVYITQEDDDGYCICANYYINIENGSEGASDIMCNLYFFLSDINQINDQVEQMCKDDRES